jgi:hypothetical protein
MAGRRLALPLFIKASDFRVGNVRSQSVGLEGSKSLACISNGVSVDVNGESSCSPPSKNVTENPSETAVIRVDLHVHVSRTGGSTSNSHKTIKLTDTSDP